ncbi:hypothetical protein [Novosphingobium naphthalenivorans]|uniref:hypothetical protein n=1 Tax=Novosphingobium naphthalenivorans TaxID=273168 RepID=UPI0012ED1754|nr:hypothetical protein [Novosphingobium naphthalenivorans]
MKSRGLPPLADGAMLQNRCYFSSRAAWSSLLMAQAMCPSTIVDGDIRAAGDASVGQTIEAIHHEDLAGEFK